MRRIRVIPVLLLSRRRGGLVKGARFRDHAYLGDATNAVKVFNDKGVDELVVLDVDATREGRPPDLEALEELCGEAFMPLAFGGGVTRPEQVREILRRGAEKVVINTAAAAPGLVEEAARLVGSQSVVVSVDVKRAWLGGPRVYTHGGTRDTGRDPLAAARAAEAAGAGEIILTSIDREGARSGYDLELLRQVSAAARIPVIASGGAGTVQHFIDAVKAGGASAVAAGTMFVFMGGRRSVLINYPSERELEAFFAAVG